MPDLYTRTCDRCECIIYSTESHDAVLCADCEDLNLPAHLKAKVAILRKALDDIGRCCTLADEQYASKGHTLAVIATVGRKALEETEDA